MRSAGAAAVAAALVLAGCDRSPSDALNGRWIGPLTPTTTGVSCTPSRGVLQMRAGIVLFEPNEGTWALQGEAKPDGSLHADKSTIGADKKVYETTLEGRWTPTAVTGTYTTPRCAFSVALSRPLG